MHTRKRDIPAIHKLRNGQVVYEEITVPPTDHYQLMVEDFAAALLDNRPPRFPPQDAVNNMQVIDRLLASVRVGGRFTPLERPDQAAG